MGSNTEQYYAFVTTNQYTYGGGDSFTTFTGNSITGNNVGIWIENPTPTPNTNPTLTLSASQNFITGNSGDGVFVNNTGSDLPVSVTLFDNDLSGNAGLAVDNQSSTSSIVDASGNWWGSNVEADVGGATFGNVDFTPFLNSGSDSDSKSSDGFQGDFSTLNVTADGDQVGLTGRIQEGIDLVAGASPLTVNVLAGTYAESVTVDKSVMLLGAQAGQNANTRFGNFTAGKADPAVESIITAPSVSPSSGAPIHIVAPQVTVDGFVIDGNNPLLTTTGAVQINSAGPYVDIRNGIDTVDPNTSVGQAVDDLTIQNNIVQNVNHDGIALINPSDG